MNTKTINFILFLLFFAISTNAQFALTAEMRTRTEYRDGFKTPKQSNDNPAFFTEQRSRLNFKFIDSSFSFKISLQDVRIWGENDQIFKQENGNTFLSESWVNYSLSDYWNIKVGRQIISYDNQRYLGGLEWAQQGRRHDAALLMYQSANQLTSVDLGFAYNADDDVPEPKNIQSPNALFYSKNNYKHMQYLWYNQHLNHLEYSILLMNLGFQYNDTDVSMRQTLGTYGKTKGKKISISWDFYYQMGRQAENKVQAYLAGANISYETKLTPIKLGIEYISGKDGDDSSDNIKHFIPDFGTNHAHNGFMDYFFVGPSNGVVGVTDLYLKTKFKFKKSNLSVHAHHFLTGSNQFDLSNEKLEKSLASELDLVFKRSISKHASFILGYSFLIPTESMKIIRDKDGSFNSWAWCMFTVKPELWNSKQLKK